SSHPEAPQRPRIGLLHWRDSTRRFILVESAPILHELPPMECSPFDYQRQDTRRREISGMTEISIEQLLRSNPIYVARYRWRLESATRSTFGASDAQRRTSGLRLHGGHRGLPLLAWERSGVRAAQGPGVLPDVLSRRQIDRMAQRGQHRTG